jgi:hypothetical protein
MRPANDTTVLTLAMLVDAEANRALRRLCAQPAKRSSAVSTASSSSPAADSSAA